MIETPSIRLFFGFVENTNDPEKSGRVQVRVVGYNTQNKGELPTENLKWFQMMCGIGASLNGIGESPTGLLNETLVVGLYISDDMQEGLILGSVPGIGDVSPIAAGDGTTIVTAKNASLATGVPDGRGSTWSQPATPYAAVYPNNKVVSSQSGHVIEYDDTPGAERISVFHKSGTFDEIHPDGKHVIRNVGDSFEIDLNNKLILVNGDYKTFINGDHYVNVAGEMYYKVGGGITFDTANTRTLGISEATDHISSNVSGRDHIHSGVKSGDEFSLNPVGATTGFFPTPANVFSLTTEDTGFTPEVISVGLKNGYLTPQDVMTQETYVPDIKQADETPTPDIQAVSVDCAELIKPDGSVNYSALLSPGVTLRSVSLGAVVSQYAIVNQVGLTTNAIVCNLKNVAENIVTPLRKQYPNSMVTSGFRAGSGTSQHLKGEAVDIQISGYSRKDYYNLAVWVKNNLPFDQLILEHKNYGTGLSWLHISLKRTGVNRKQVMTFFNNKKYADGLRDMN